MRLPDFLLHPLIRRRAGFHRIPLDRYRVFVARTAPAYEDAFRLVHAAYVFMGFEGSNPEGMRIVAQHPLSESTVFVAYEGKRLVGTMTVIQDSPAGLPLDKQYPKPLERLRRDGAKLVEYASLAVVQRCWHTGVVQLLGLAAYNFAYNTLGATHTVVGMNPKAGAFYKAVFDFEDLGEGQPHSELVAPVAGLVQHMDRTPEFMRRKFKKPMASGKLPHEHGVGAPPPNVELPPKDLDEEAFARWKLPREVFQELFMMRSDRLRSLSREVMTYLQTQRSRETLNVPELSAHARAKTQQDANAAMEALLRSFDQMDTEPSLGFGSGHRPKG